MYMTRIRPPDVAMAAMYGGITTMGLWCIDTKAMLARGSTPPFSFSHSEVTNPIKYKLFAKKVFTRDIATVKDVEGIVSGFDYCQKYWESYPGAFLQIYWKLKFI